MPSGRPGVFYENFIWCSAAVSDDTALLCRATPPEPIIDFNEIAPLDHDEAAAPPLSRGGLSGWQQRTVSAFIEAHLGEALRLADLAQLVHLSPFHFARAFKQSFGVPPHRYHVDRRIARAKNLLADPEKSVTGIARELGFAETSSFSSTFRRVTGTSPSSFRRAGA